MNTTVLKNIQFIFDEVGYPATVEEHPTRPIIVVHHNNGLIVDVDVEMQTITYYAILPVEIVKYLNQLILPSKQLYYIKVSIWTDSERHKYINKSRATNKIFLSDATFASNIQVQFTKDEAEEIIKQLSIFEDGEIELEEID